MEFGDDGVMVINAKATGIAMFEMSDVVRSFKCGHLGEVVTPPGLNMIDQMLYVAKATSRKGGYNHIVRELVIAASIHKGEFNDSVLWQKQ